MTSNGLTPSSAPFAGAAVNADGTWAPKTTEALTLSAGTTNVTLPPASAALLILE